MDFLPLFLPSTLSSADLSSPSSPSSASLLEYQHSLQVSIDQLERKLQIERATPPDDPEGQGRGRGREGEGERQEEVGEREGALPPLPTLHVPPITVPVSG